MRRPSDVLIGLNVAGDAIRCGAFGRAGEELAGVAVPNEVRLLGDDGAEQDAALTWQGAARALLLLADKVPDLARRTVALAITGERGGVWLVDEDGDPLATAPAPDDARAAPLVEAWRRTGVGDAVQARTGTALDASLPSAQLARLQRETPEILEAAATVLSTKDWLYFCCTGERASEACEAIASFGNLRRGAYDDEVLRLLGLEEAGRLLPEMVDGARHAGELVPAAAAATGLYEGTPVVLAPPEAAAAALAAGMPDAGPGTGCTVLGRSASHLRLLDQPAAPTLAREQVGQIARMPGTPSWAAVVASAGALGSVDWLAERSEELLADAGLIGVARQDLLTLLDAKVERARPGRLLFHPFMARCGERGPLVDARARAQLLGLSRSTTLSDIMRVIYEGIAFTARDCYRVLDHAPDEVRLVCAAGPAGTALRRILAAGIGAPVRPLARELPMAAGAALWAAVALRQYERIEDGFAEWVVPYLADPEPVDEDLCARYQALFETWRLAYRQMGAVWAGLAATRSRSG